MIRYSTIRDKNPREIVLLRASGCKWKKCTFCDYHLDSSKDEESNYILNKKVLEKVTGEYRHLEVINSGSFCELDEQTIELIRTICKEKSIAILHFECHYLYRNRIAALRERFESVGTELKIKTGVETFDFEFRENVLKKGIPASDPKEIAKYFDECCLLFGISGQTAKSMTEDIETGLSHFERVCVNIMTKNTTNILPDQDVISIFKKEVMPNFANNDRVDILISNTDFGVGEKGEEP